MKGFHKLFIAFIFSLALVSCDAIDDMTGLFEKKGQVEEHIKTNHGLDTTVGFNINNGALTQVSIFFNSNDVKDRSIAELEKIGLTAVALAFKLTPQALNITIQSSPEEDDIERIRNRSK